MRPQTAPAAEQIARSLRSQGLEVWLYTNWEEQHLREHMPPADMVVAIGGDGAMLKAARVCAPCSLPLLGLNMGRLGFLTEIARLEDWDAAIRQVLDGHYRIEERMMLRASVLRGGETLFHGHALNDVVVSGSVVGRMIEVEAYIDDNWTTTYNADALIIATPTGSTAYALAVGGPILPPELHNILVVPAAPHLSLDRPLVLSEGSVVEVRAASKNRADVLLTVDGHVLGRLEPADCVRVQASEHISRFIRLREPDYFYRSLLDRLEPRVNRRRPESEE